MFHDNSVSDILSGTDWPTDFKKKLMRFEIYFERSICLLVNQSSADLRYINFLLAEFKIKLKLRSFKSSEHINEKGDGPYRGFGYLSLFSDPLDLATWRLRE